MRATIASATASVNAPFAASRSRVRGPEINVSDTAQALLLPRTPRDSIAGGRRFTPRPLRVEKPGAGARVAARTRSRAQAHAAAAAHGIARAAATLTRDGAGALAETLANDSDAAADVAAPAVVAVAQLHERAASDRDAAALRDLATP